MDDNTRKRIVNFLIEYRAFDPWADRLCDRWQSGELSDSDLLFYVEAIARTGDFWARDIRENLEERRGEWKTDI
ncbi:MAG: hypothetical protein J7642_21395 [Cyanobacteria bacterium SBC]|nr:hypothetical protein [Cyanobacteria bacterium SBC]